MRGVSAEPGASPLFEIRVHGVSGTPPEDMLQEPNVVRVAGDAAAGFYQARTAQSVPQPVAPVEAYSWSGLTSGGKWRALWLLLVPFMLVNVAYYASSAPLSGPGRARRIHSAVLRLLALSLTFTFVLGIISVSMDLIAWQYLRPGRDVTQPLLKWLRWEWINLPRRQVALISAVPVAMVGLLWWLARQTWARTERTSVPVGPASAAASAVAPTGPAAASPCRLGRPLPPCRPSRPGRLGRLGRLGCRPRRLRIARCSTAAGRSASCGRSTSPEGLR